MVIQLIFSQPNMSYFYYENGKGYTYEDYVKQLLIGGDSVAGGSGSALFYDDGGVYKEGYTESDSRAWTTAAAGSTIILADGSSSSASSQSSSSTVIDDSALRG